MRGHTGPTDPTQPCRGGRPRIGQPVHPREGQSHADLLCSQTHSGATPSLGSLSLKRMMRTTQRTTKPCAPAWWPLCRRTGDRRGPGEPSCRPSALSSTRWALWRFSQPVLLLLLASPLQHPSKGLTNRNEEGDGASGMRLLAQVCTPKAVF